MSNLTRPPVAQMDLFSSVLHAYAGTSNGVLDNKTLYETAASALGLSDRDVHAKAPIGKSGALHSPFKRQVRWYQQTLKGSGILERVDGEHGIWQLTKPASKDLNQISNNVSVVGFSTDLGIAILGYCETVFQRMDVPITLVLTSPPYPLSTPRAYGNVPLKAYVAWICKTLEPLVKNLAPGGSICLNVSNDIFLPGMPARSTYVERLVIALEDELGLYKMDTLIWENKSKPPGPIRYASIDRTQLNVVYEPILWFTNNPLLVKSDNRRVLEAHSQRHLDLIAGGGEQREGSFSDGAYTVKPGRYANPTEGRIPRNILSFGHRCAEQTAYKKAARAMGLPAHGAPMPLKLAKFLINLLTVPGEVVAEPFGGSMTTASAAEQLGRRWIASECVVEYVMGGSTRFVHRPGYQNFLLAA